MLQRLLEFAQRLGGPFSLANDTSLRYQAVEGLEPQRRENYYGDLRLRAEASVNCSGHNAPEKLCLHRGVAVRHSECHAEATGLSGRTGDENRSLSEEEAGRQIPGQVTADRSGS